MRLLPAADRTEVPGRNAGGVTREIAAFPVGAGFDDFDWRVSIAVVERSGPFSRFPGVDRTLAVLEGVLLLEIGGETAVTVESGGAPVKFDGGAPAVGHIRSDRVVDLNVMCRGGRVVADVRRILVVDTETIEPSADWTILVASSPTRSMATGIARCSRRA